MSGFSAIELSRLPFPGVVETLDFEKILEDMKCDLLRREPSLIEALELESEPLTQLLEVFAYRELLLRARINDATQAVMLAYAKGADLDNLAALFGVSRLVVEEGEPEAQPPAPPTYEDDERLRHRVQLSLEGHSTAGPRGSYVFWGLSASPRVKDIEVQSPAPGDVEVTVLSTEGSGEADEELLFEVYVTLNCQDVRPLTDRVTVRAAKIIPYQVQASLTLYDGPDGEVVRQAAEKAANDYVIEHHRLGHDITLSGLYAALHQPGVQRVTLTQPTADVVVLPNQAAYCSALNVSMGGRNE